MLDQVTHVTKITVRITEVDGTQYSYRVTSFRRDDGFETAVAVYPFGVGAPMSFDLKEVLLNLLEAYLAAKALDDPF